MGDELRTSVDRMREASRFEADRADAIDAGLKKLDDRLSQLFGDGWRGVAGSSFAEEWSELHGGARRCVDALRGSSELLSETANRYEARDDATADQLRRV